MTHLSIGIFGDVHVSKKLLSDKQRRARKIPFHPFPPHANFQRSKQKNPAFDFKKISLKQQHSFVCNVT